MPLKELVRDTKNWEGLRVIELATLTRRLSDSVPALEVFLATVMLEFFQVEASCGKNTLDDCMFLPLAMIETGNEWQLSAQLLLLSNDAIVVGWLHGSIVSAKFLLVIINMLSAAHETYNAFVVVWYERTEHAAYPET